MFEQAVDLEPQFALAWAWLSIVHSRIYWFRWDFSSQRLMQAKETANRAAQLDSDLPETHLALAYYHYHGYREYEQALNELDLVEQKSPRNPELFEARGYIKRRQGNWSEAIADLKKAVSLDPRNVLLFHELGDCYRALRRYDDAADSYDEALAINPAIPVTLHRRAAVSLLSSGDLEPLRAFYSAHPDFDPASRSKFELLNRDYSAALEAVSDIEDEIVVDQTAYNPKSLYAGLVHHVADQPEEAKAAFQSARAILEAAMTERPDHPPLHRALGLAYAGLGMKEAAIREGQKAVELMPVSKDAHFASDYVESLAQIYTLVGEYDAAIKELERVLSSPSFYISAGSIQRDPIWDPLRSNPHFADLLR